MKYYLDVSESCELRPVTDDMALCHTKCKTIVKNLSYRMLKVVGSSGWIILRTMVLHLCMKNIYPAKRTFIILKYRWDTNVYLPCLGAYLDPMELPV